MLTIEKIYKNAKTDSKGKPYTLINFYSDGKKYTFFAYDVELSKLEAGDTFDTNGWEEKESVYQGKTSYILQRPSKKRQEEDLIKTTLAIFKKEIEELKARVKKLEEDKVFPKATKPVVDDVLDIPDNVPSDLPFD